MTMNVLLRLLAASVALLAVSAAGDEGSDIAEEARRIQERARALERSMQATVEAHREREANETRIDALLDRFFDEAERGEYARARGTLDEWEAIQPGAPQVRDLRSLVDDLEAEPDPAARNAILAEFAADGLEEMTGTVEDLDRALRELDAQLERMERESGSAAD